MFDSLIKTLAHLLSWMFLIGLAGCIVVIPIAAYRLFSVLFEKDQPGEEEAPKSSKPPVVPRPAD